MTSSTSQSANDASLQTDDISTEKSDVTVQTTAVSQTGRDVTTQTERETAPCEAERPDMRDGVTQTERDNLSRQRDHPGKSGTQTDGGIVSSQKKNASKAVLPAVGEITPAKAQATVADLEEEHLKHVLQFLDFCQLFRVRRGKQSQS